MVSKWEIFGLTFLAYTGIHALRTSYSESKSSIQKDLDIDSKLMGVLDSIMLTFLGIGHFLHAVRPMKKPVRNLWIALILCALNFISLPMLIDADIFHNYAYLLIFQILNGFMQSYTWPTLLTVINSRFCSKQNSTLLGFWSTNANFGNIIGYFVFQIIRSHWKINLIIIGIYTLANGLLIWLRVSQVVKQPSLQPLSSSCLTSDNKDNLNQNLIDNNSNITISETQIKDKNEQQQAPQQSQEQKPTKLSGISALRQPKILLITISFSLTKSVIYGIMLWLPLYFQTENGLKQYASQIPITYDIAAIFGSIFIGYLFIKIINKGLLMIPFMVVLVLCFFFLRFLSLGVVAIFFVIGIVGFCLGGTFNTLAGLVVVELTSVLPEQLKSSSIGFYSALTMAFANITTAATQLLIGFVIGKQHQEGIFLVFLIYSAVCLVCLILMSIISKAKPTTEEKAQIVCQGSVQADIKGQISAEVQAHPAASLDAHSEFKNRLLIDDKISEVNRKLSTSSQDDGHFGNECKNEKHAWCKSGYERNVYDQAI